MLIISLDWKEDKIRRNYAIPRCHPIKLAKELDLQIEHPYNGSDHHPGDFHSRLVVV
jgi:hypothetical protein